MINPTHAGAVCAEILTAAPQQPLPGFSDAEATALLGDPRLGSLRQGKATNPTMLSRQQLLFVLLLPVSMVLTGCRPITPSPPVMLPTATAPPATPVCRDGTQTCPQDMEREAMNAELIQAAERGDTATVLQLLAAGAEINSRDERGRTAVMAATQGNRVATVQALIAAGADINLQDNRLDNPFLYAGAEGLLAIVKLTIDAGADTKLTNRFGGTALIPAAERGHVEVVTELLTRSDVAVDHVNNLGWTALLEAIILGDGGPRSTAVVELLINAGADVNLADSQGVTPLAHARQRGYTQIIELLQNAGAQ